MAWFTTNSEDTEVSVVDVGTGSASDHWWPPGEKLRASLGAERKREETWWRGISRDPGYHHQE